MTTPAPAAPLAALAISMVRNEADVIEASIRHNLAYVDLYVVVDNGSNDGTREILEAMRDEGLPLIVLDDPVAGHFQSERITAVYRRVAPIFDPALVYLLDADEFIRAPGRAALEGVLARIEPGGVALLPWRTHLPDPSVPAAERLADPLGAAPLRRRVEEPAYVKTVIRRDPRDDATLVVEQGNHGVNHGSGRTLRGPLIDGAWIAHLPVRSTEQLSAKVVNGWHALMVRNRFRNVPSEAYQWEALYRRVTRGEGLTDALLVQAALDYAQAPRADRNPATDAVRDPTPALYGTLRHLALGRHSALAKVALAVEAMLRDGAAPQAAAGTPAEPVDLPPLLDLIDRTGARAVAATPGAGLLKAELHALRPGLAVASDRADLLVAIEPTLDDCLARAAETVTAVPARIVCAPKRTPDANAVGRALDAWRALGWTPDLMCTLTLRALASYGATRTGALVLAPADPEGADRAARVDAALRAMAARPVAWNDPPPDRIRHPLQTLALHRAGAPAQPAAMPAHVPLGA